MLKNQLKKAVSERTKRYIKLIIRKKENLNNILKICPKLDKG